MVNYNVWVSWAFSRATTSFRLEGWKCSYQDRKMKSNSNLDSTLMNHLNCNLSFLFTRLSLVCPKTAESRTQPVFWNLNFIIGLLKYGNHKKLAKITAQPFKATRCWSVGPHWGLGGSLISSVLSRDLLLCPISSFPVLPLPTTIISCRVSQITEICHPHSERRIEQWYCMNVLNIWTALGSIKAYRFNV